MLGDAGYESEGFHRLCREQLGIESIIPTTHRGRPRDDGDINPVNGKYRQLMKELFPKELYGQRWQIETVFSMLQRNLGSAVRSRKHYNQTREIRLRVLAHNLMILWYTILCFIQSRTLPILSAMQNNSYLQKERLEKMENASNDAMGTALVVISLLSVVMDLLLRIIFESRLPSFIRFIFGVVFLVLFLSAIIIFLGALINVFRKKSKGNITK